ncbi:DUF4247 domain-containing protein [Paenibacillus humicola]|uniref:DUF4247 domain-containing protein n=1 Tax=Paenibacillus humicola TaxID=3110540 RepID=UPI00237A3329|nr:DUF4247 domain-containing protein [Paenibacillus humicola]
MRSRLSLWLKHLVIVSFIVPLLAACGISDTIADKYPLESVSGSGSATSYVYRAAGESVPQVAKELADEQKPQQESPEKNDHMFLVYSDKIIHLQQDEKKPEDTLVEVDSKEYVRDNYSSSFLQGYLVASLLNDLFDYGRYGSGSYRGYTDRGTYKPKTGTYHVPSAQEKKAIPPMTVEKKGSIFRRSKDADSSAAGTGGIFNKAPPKSSGKITRGSSKSGGWFSPPKSSRPRTKSGFGRITRRR